MVLLLLFLLSWLAATISGAAGFGGALLLLPVLTHVLGVKVAVPVLTIMQVLGNLSRVWFGRHHISWKPVGYFLVGALPMTLIGSMLFTKLSSSLITIGIGILLIVIVILRYLGYTRFMVSHRGLFFGGVLTGFLSGVAGSAGPLGAAFFLGLDLPGVAYVATEAVTAVTMHITKIAVYQRYAFIGIVEIQYGLFLGSAMIIGSWTGKQIIERLPKKMFHIIIEILLVISGLQLIFFT